ncbi:hypothetical protein BH11PSE8_BH11PSE8_05990 [soil metagenome]
MKKTLFSAPRKFLRHHLRLLFGLLPKEIRFAIFRSMVDCDPEPEGRLQLKIADTREELEACFSILHDAYVQSGFMKPDSSGLRVTAYHALPTTTTLCAKFDGKVVGTMSLIREGVFGFPLQSVFDLTNVREKGGKIAEISALAVHPSFRKTGGTILFPLMKFMYEYCTTFFDTQHLVIAVNPNKIEMYESLLFFERLQESAVANYDFANGAPAVGATLDLHRAPELMRQTYGKKKGRKNLHDYFVNIRLPNIALPARRYFTTNDPVMTPEMLDHFFNRRCNVFGAMEDRKKQLLHSIYDRGEYRKALPAPMANTSNVHPLRKHQRFSLKSPGLLELNIDGLREAFRLRVVEVSLYGFKAECDRPLPLDLQGSASVELGANERSVVACTAVRLDQAGASRFYGFRISEPDASWRKCVDALEQGHTHLDLMAA